MFAGHLAPPIAAGIYGSHDLHQHVAAPLGQLPIDEEGAIGWRGGAFFMPLDALLGSRRPSSPLRFSKVVSPAEMCEIWVYPTRVAPSELRMMAVALTK